MNSNVSESSDGYEVVPFSRFQHQTVDWLGMMHGRHTAYLLMEVDITEARRAIQESWAGSGIRNESRTAEPVALTAFITACLARAVGEDKRLQAYRKGRNRLMLFDDVDVTMLVDNDVEKRKSQVPHIIRAANTKSLSQIESEIEVATKSEESAAEVWLPFWLLLPAPARELIWKGLLSNPRMRKRITGTVAVSAAGMLGSGSVTGARWGIPLTAYTLSLDLGGISWKPGLVGRISPGAATRQRAGRDERVEQVEVREYLCMTLSVDDDIVNSGQAARFAARLAELIETGAGFSAVQPCADRQVDDEAPGQGHGQRHECRQEVVLPDHTAAIKAIKAIHTMIFLCMGSCVGYLLYSGLVGRMSRLAKLSLATLAIEGLIYSRNGLRCPLADMAEDLGSAHGTVGDIFLPRWFADRIPIISSLFLAISFVAMMLHRIADGWGHNG